MSEKFDCWEYPAGYEKVKALIDFMPEEEKDMYLMMLVDAMVQV